MRFASELPGAVALAAAIALEVAGTTSMKLSEGFTRLVPSVAMAVCYVGSLAMLTLALRTIALGTAYAIWAGVGTALVAGVGVVVFREPLSALRVAGVACVIAGVVALHLAERSSS
jgi:small multidrug resistance pump